MKKIATILIDVENRIITAEDAEGTGIVWAAVSDGRSAIKWTQASAAGHVIQALVRMLEDKGPS